MDAIQSQFVMRNSVTMAPFCLLDHRCMRGSGPSAATTESRYARLLNLPLLLAKAEPATKMGSSRREPETDRT